MTTREACGVTIELVRELSSVRAAADGWRLVAVTAVHHAHDLHLQTERLRSQNVALREELRRYIAAIFPRQPEAA